MRELNLNVRDDGRPSYLRIAEALRRAIRSGRLTATEPLPSTRRLAESLSVHRHTVMAAMDELVAEGWLSAREKRGYFVAETLPDRFHEAHALPSPASAAHTFRIVRGGEPEPFDVPLHARHRFQSGLADLRLFPRDEFRRELGAVLRARKLEALDYADPAGQPKLIAELKDYLRRLRAIRERELVITNGSQEGIFLVAQCLLRAGDQAGVEALGYPPAWAALRSAGARLVPLAVDEEGLIPESLERALKRSSLRLIYLTPLHQYPTTVTLPISRRLRIYELAARYKVPILEDDYDHEYHYRSEPLAPLAADDPHGIVIYLSTFSKVLFPSARIGFLAVPKKLAPALVGLRRILTRQGSSLVQEAVARWMTSGGLERHLRKMRRTYQLRRDTMVETLRAMPELTFQAPDGGMAIWVDTGADSQKVARVAAALGVWVTPGSSYRLDRAHDQRLRLGFANQTPEEIRAGLTLLRQAVRSCRQ